MKMIKQGIYFSFISGIGWIFDACMFWGLVDVLNVTVMASNVMSSLLATTFVFFFATRKVFTLKKSYIPIKRKYEIYLVYQIMFIIAVSFVAETVYWSILAKNVLSVNLCSIVTKCLITPLTMICNFFVMKFLTENI